MVNESSDRVDRWVNVVDRSPDNVEGPTDRVDGLLHIRVDVSTDGRSL